MHFDRGQDFDRAVRHYRTTAENALTRNADREAHIALCTASELTAHLSPGDDRERMELDLRVQLGRAVERFERQIRWPGLGVDEGGIGRGDADDLVGTMIRLSILHSVAGDLAAAKEIGDRAAALRPAGGRARFDAMVQQAYVRLLAGEFCASRALAVEALAAADDDGVNAPHRARIRCSIVLAWTAWYLGRYGELRATIESVLSRDDAQAIASSLAPLLESLGDTDRSLALLRPQRGVQLQSGLCDAPWPIESVHGWLLIRRRRVSQGLRRLREQAQQLRTTGVHASLPYTLVWLAEALQANAHVEEALAAAEEGLGVVRRTGFRCCDAELYGARGEAMMAKQRPTAAGAIDRNRDAAESSFWAGITVARQQEARTLELRTTLSLCRLLIDSGRREEGIRALAPLCEAFGTSDTTPDLVEARRLVSGDAA